MNLKTIQIKHIAFVISLGITYCASGKVLIDEEIINKVEGNNTTHLLRILSTSENSYEPYQVIVHSDEVKKLIKHDYDASQIVSLIEKTKETRKLEVIHKPWGSFILATNFSDNKTAEDTHYDAIWVRDSLWGYLALNTEEMNGDSKKILLTLWDYFSTKEQSERLKVIIDNPSLINDAKSQMLVPHIRFDSNSSHFSDVNENGQPQNWNHKQNDALGLFLDSVLNAIKQGQIEQKDWSKGDRIASLVNMLKYLDAVEYYNMPDSGAWEEDERVNTSSIGAVTSAFENLLNMLDDKKNDNVQTFKSDLSDFAITNNYQQFLVRKNISELVDKGYKRIYTQLEMGGESPDYNKTHSKYRTADAALLSLIYPSNLSRLKSKDKEKILDIVETLAGTYGIKRYENDNYQSANFWYENIKTDVEVDSHNKRKENFIPSSEAQWFFDSWFATASFKLYNETQNKHYRDTGIRYLNRSLAQITGKNMIGANGRNVPKNAIPESYNFLYKDGLFFAAPSPIIPLNWAKSSLTIMLQQAKDNI